jgi:hypothetical protein
VHEGRKQIAEEKKVCAMSFLNFFNWIVISAMLYRKLGLKPRPSRTALIVKF